MGKEKLENQLEILKTCVHKLKGGKHIDNKAYNQLLSVIADFHLLIDFDCTICYDTGWYGGVSHDEKPCPECNPLDYKRTIKNKYTVEYKHPMYGSNVKEKHFDSLNNIEHKLKQQGVGNYRIY